MNGNRYIEKQKAVDQLPSKISIALTVKYKMVLYKSSFKNENKALTQTPDLVTSQPVILMHFHASNFVYFRRFSFLKGKLFKSIKTIENDSKLVGCKTTNLPRKSVGLACNII